MGNLLMNTLKKGIIYISGEINYKVANAFLHKMDYLIDKCNTIKVFINTEGGDLCDAMAIVDKIDLAKQKGINIITIGIGQVASAGIFILASGSNRMSTINCSFLIHPMIHSYGNDYHAHIKQYLEFTNDYYNTLMTDLAVKCGKKKSDEIKRFIKQAGDSIWLDTDGAQEIGLIEGIWTENEKNKQ